MMAADDAIDFEAVLKPLEANRHLFQLFMEGVAKFFQVHPRLLSTSLPAVHSVKSRIKDIEHLKEKLARQHLRGVVITADDIFQRITDIAGVRVLHLYQQQLADIDGAIRENVDAGEWVFEEAPKAYSWDPDASEFFRGLGLEVEIKQSHYTSVHYLVRPRPKAIVCCEIQVRTLFEEVWGEIDHSVNYPMATECLAIKEQLRVLAKLVATGSRLADGIFRIENEERVRVR